MNKPYIDLKGVRVHNLKNIDLKIELNKLIVITGVSGSGKSSLAFDTLYAEGQRGLGSGAGRCPAARCPAADPLSASERTNRLLSVLF